MPPPPGSHSRLCTQTPKVFTDPDGPSAPPIPRRPLPESRDMQPICRLRLAPAHPHPQLPRAGAATTSQARRATMSRGCAWCVAPARRLRAAHAPCGGGGTTEPVEALKDGPAVDQATEAWLLAPEELEVLEEEAIAGEDEGRRPTDYDRRAHIFEESSRVFRELKKRSGGGGVSESGPGGVTTGATAAAAETRACNKQQQTSS